MWFSVYDYPKFTLATNLTTWHHDFIEAGFKTYRYRRDEINDRSHWLDDYEYTWFLLRYS